MFYIAYSKETKKLLQSSSKKMMNNNAKLSVPITNI